LIDTQLLSEMAYNFFEVAVLEPAAGTSFSNPDILKDLQSILGDTAAGGGGIDFKFRQAIDDPEKLLMGLSWEMIEAHDDLDIQGVRESIPSCSRSF